VKLAGASPHEIRRAAHLLGGAVSVLTEELTNGGEPDFEQVALDFSRVRVALRQLEDALRWRIEMDECGEQT